MGRVYQLLARFCILIWIVSPCYGQSVNNVLPLTQAAGFLTTKVQLYNNLTATYQGKFYKFPTSTTAGIQEVQQLIYQTPQDTNGRPNTFFGPEIELMDNGVYPFSTKIFITNQMRLIGQGCFSSILQYVGPTNIITVSQVTNLTTKSILNIGYNPPQSDLCGLINFVGTIQLSQNGALTNVGGTFIVKNVGFSVATNLPCIELCVGQCNRFQIDSCSFGDSTVNNLSMNGYMQGNAGATTNGNAVIPLYSWAYASTLVQNCWFQCCACGPIIGGNTFLRWVNNEIRNMGDSTHKTNFFPVTAPISIPFGMYSTGVPFYTYIEAGADITTFVPYIIDNAFTAAGLVTQASISGVNIAAGANGSANSSIFTDVPQTLGCLIQDGSGKWVISSTNSDMNNFAVIRGYYSGNMFFNNTNVLTYGDTVGTTWLFQTNLNANGIIGANNPPGTVNYNNGFASPGNTTNTLPVASTGVTNNTTINYVFSSSAGTGMTIQDAANHTFVALAASSCVILHPSWRVTGTGITAICVAQ